MKTRLRSNTSQGAARLQNLTFAAVEPRLCKESDDEKSLPRPLKTGQKTGGAFLLCNQGSTRTVQQITTDSFRTSLFNWLEEMPAGQKGQN